MFENRSISGTNIAKQYGWWKSHKSIVLVSYRGFGVVVNLPKREVQNNSVRCYFSNEFSNGRINLK